MNVTKRTERKSKSKGDLMDENEVVQFKGAQSRLNGLKSLAKLFNFVVF